MPAANDHTVKAPLNTAEEIATGRVIYGANCASCHGENLEGEPNWRSIKLDGTMPAPPHDENGHTWHHDDQLLFAYTKEGGQSVIGRSFKSGMPGFGEMLTDEEIWAVLAYIKDSWPETIRKRQQKISSARKEKE